MTQSLELIGSGVIDGNLGYKENEYFQIVFK